MPLPFKEIQLAPKDFSTNLRGLRIIQLSDLHLSKRTKLSYLKNLINEVNSYEPDLVLFTGDIIEGLAITLTEHFKLFQELHAPAYYVSGNHDLFFGLKSLKKQLTLANITCIDNACAYLNINAEPLQIVGLAFSFSKKRASNPKIKELLASLDKNISTILLTHTHKDITLLKDYRIDILLSSHTHNAGIFPFRRLLKKIKPKKQGAFLKGKTLVYVSSGLNTSSYQLKSHLCKEIPVLTINGDSPYAQTKEPF